MQGRHRKNFLHFLDATHVRMVKFFNSSTDYSHSWDKVTLALFNKYPNPFSTHVLTSDVIDRYVIGEKLITVRLLKKKSKVPKWGQFIFKMNEAYILEYSCVDVRKQEMTTTTRNLSHKKIMLIEERLTIKQHPMNMKETQILTNVRFISNSSFMKNQIEGFGLHRFKNNIHNSSKGLLYVLNLSN